MNDEQIEALILARGKTAPRVTPQHIEAVIEHEYYFTASQGWLGNVVQNQLEQLDGRRLTLTGLASNPDNPLHLLTFCVLILENGFTVTGESACASPENFDAEIGREIARQNAVAKIWPLEGYLLRHRLNVMGC